MTKHIINYEDYNQGYLTFSQLFKILIKNALLDFNLKTCN